MNDRIGRTAILVPVYQAQEDFDDSMRCVAASQCKCDVIAVDDGSDPPLQIGSYGHDLCVHLIRLTKRGNRSRFEHRGALRSRQRLQVPRASRCRRLPRAGEVSETDRLPRPAPAMHVGGIRCRPERGKWRVSIHNKAA